MKQSLLSISESMKIEKQTCMRMSENKIYVPYSPKLCCNERIASLPAMEAPLSFLYANNETKEEKLNRSGGKSSKFGEDGGVKCKSVSSVCVTNRLLKKVVKSGRNIKY